jgi:predicted ATPase
MLLETHSEHLVLRLLRRIRESADAVNESSSLKPNDISIVYLTSTFEGTVTQRLKITSDGDFEQNWPNGFFNERDEELF